MNRSHQTSLSLFALLLLGWCSAGMAQSPVYSLTLPDAVTGDASNGSVPQSFSVTGVSCTNCRIPDPNPPAGAGAVDNYTLDIYERPTQSGAAANVYFSALDIVSYDIGFDPTWMYFRIQLFAVDNQGSGKRLPYYYAYEINFDSDVRGDLFVRSEDPSGKGLNDTFGSSGVIAFWDQNNNHGDGSPGSPDGPGASAQGYETLAFDQGTNNVAGAPGGATAVRARTILIGGVPYIELAVQRVFLNALKGSAVTQASFRPYASKAGGTTNPNNMPLHDEYDRRAAGSPYPWLQQSGAPGTCPNTNAADDALTVAQRAALNSGGNVASAFSNPCYPSGGNLVEFDNAGTINDLAGGILISFTPPTVTKAFSPANISAGGVSTVTITLTAANSTPVIGVSFTDTFPVTPGQMSLANTTVTNTCGGTVTDGAGAALNAGDVAFRLTGGTIPGSGSCALTFQVTASTSGSYLNTTGAVSTSNAGTATAATATLVVSQPLTVVKAAQVFSDPFNGSTNPKAIPGAFVTYSIVVNNPSTSAVDSNAVVLIDAIPANTDLFVGDLGVAGSGPIAYFAGSPASGLSYSFISLASAGDDLSFSSLLDCASFGYTPVAGANGVDSQVCRIRVNPKNTFNASRSFQIQFRVRVE